ncbi:BsuPI-related putative proteinase inhibitor [Peribacillus alkalitolerans]|uniref:BsuPI-related putative proteinase inhibitor n=1 Tax=Peribacillus alkalitolerans TaxID=1550385 RepID=UPI0013D57BC3|nr:BsuPI-related putative proteinase inhibitor [Peribacillus alkalitolerans]
MQNLRSSLILNESPDGNLTFTYEIKNVGSEMAILHFNTSQIYEYEIFNKDHGRVYRYSDGKYFLQVLKEIRILPSESLSYDIKIPPLEKGEFTFTIWLVAQDGYQLKQSQRFNVR